MPGSLLNLPKKKSLATSGKYSEVNIRTNRGSATGSLLNLPKKKNLGTSGKYSSEWDVTRVDTHRHGLGVGPLYLASGAGANKRERRGGSEERRRGASETIESSNRVNTICAADTAAKEDKIGVAAKDSRSSPRRTRNSAGVHNTSDMVSRTGAADAAGKAGGETHRLIGPRPLSSYPVVPFDEDEKETEARRRAWCWGWLPRVSSLFPRPEPEPIRVGVPLDYLQLQRLEDSFPYVLGRSERLARHQKIVEECLGWYNAMHPDDEYEPAPGAVTEGSRLGRGKFWTHGNFVARRKRSGCFSFLPAPRTLFFFEQTRGNNNNEVVTCTPLDEPVTEAYDFLGFRFGWGTRRVGKSDCICKTCYRRHPYAVSTCVCEDSKVEPVCDMCYPRCCVIHPLQGGFAMGYDTKLLHDYFRPDHRGKTC